MPNLTDHGDALERQTWPTMQAYISKYEVLWQMHVEPLRNPGAIDLRNGIDPDFELFAMNHYSVYINLVRAREKIEAKSDDLGFAEEIWAQLQRAVEVAIKEEEAFRKIYFDVTKKKPHIDIRKLEELKKSIGDRRNTLHDPIPASIKDANGTRLIPHRDALQKYQRWTDVMYRRSDADFVPVDTELRKDFERVCGILQGFWSDIERESKKILENNRYLERRESGRASTVRVYDSPVQTATATSTTSTTSNVAVFGHQSPWWK